MGLLGVLSRPCGVTIVPLTNGMVPVVRCGELINLDLSGLNVLCPAVFDFGWKTTDSIP